MKKNNYLFLLLLTLIFAISSCKDDNNTVQVDPFTKITSAQYVNKLLFVNNNNFQIETSEQAEFSSTSNKIKISSTGLITRVTSGEVVPISVKFNSDPSNPIIIYALGDTDNNHDEPYLTYHGLLATETDASYKKGWATLQKLPSTTAGETYGIVLRHADASVGRDRSTGTTTPTDWWKSKDAALARQLNQQGKDRALELGKIFKDLQYPIARVISSEYYRSVQTGEIMNLGLPITTDARINHPSYNRLSLFTGMINIMKAQPADGKITLMISHHPINETGSPGYPTFPAVSPYTWTGAYLIKIAADKTIIYEGAVSWGMFKLWRDQKLGL